MRLRGSGSVSEAFSAPRDIVVQDSSERTSEVRGMCVSRIPCIHEIGSQDEERWNEKPVLNVEEEKEGDLVARERHATVKNDP
jgi:hypothetical protein